MKKIIILITLAYCSLNLIAQNPYHSILSEIEQNNTLLAATRSETDAEKISNKTGLLPDSPEVEYHYLWGTGDDGGTCQDISASQSFDFPTVYYHKKKVSDKQNSQLDLKYMIDRKDIMLEAYKLCVELSYLNKLTNEYSKQYDYAKQTADAYQASFDKGNANRIELNKANISLINAEKNLKAAEMERDFVYAELVRLNGGQDFQFLGSYPVVIVPANFEAWYGMMKENNLSLRYLEQELNLNKSSEKLQRSLNLPKFSAGYMREGAPHEQFQGLTVGMSIPLWENRNTVRQIKAHNQAIVATQVNEDLRFRNETKAQYDKLVYLKKILDMYESTVADTKTVDLLKKAMEGGEISLIDYLQELEVFYEMITNKLETERDLHLVWADLIQWEL